jgi:Protein of unknown function (DUF3592).
VPVPYDRAAFPLPPLLELVRPFGVAELGVRSLKMHYYLLVISVPLWWMALRLFYRQTSFLLTSVSTTGHLVDWKESRTRSRSYWYPIVSFTASDGISYKIIGNSGYGTKPSYQIGHSFPVRYNPSYPKTSQVSSFLHFWMAPFCFFILASAASFAFLKNAQIL